MMKKIFPVFIAMGVMLLPKPVYSQTYFGDTLWARDYSSTGAFSCAFSPDGTRLAVAYECMGPMVRVIDVDNGQILWESETPDLCLYNIQFSSNGQYIAIAEELGHLIVVDITIPDTIYNIDTQSGGLYAVDFSTAGDYIYTGCADGSVRVYETATGIHQYTIPAHTGAVFSIDVSTSGQYLASGSQDNTVKIWDLWNGNQMVHHLTEHTDDVKTVKFTPDENRLLTGSADDMIHVYLVPGGALDTILMLHTGDVNTIDISADGFFAVSGSNDQSVEMINLHNYASAATFTNQLQTRVYGVAISPQMDKMAAANHIGYVIMYHIQSLIGIEETGIHPLVVYPNPANEFIMIKWQYEPLPYRIYNSSGALVANGVLADNMIDISTFRPGIYILQLGIGYQRFIKI